MCYLPICRHASQPVYSVAKSWLTRHASQAVTCTELAHKTLTDWPGALQTWSSANNESFKEKHCGLWELENSVLRCTVLSESDTDSIERHACIHASAVLALECIDFTIINIQEHIYTDEYTLRKLGMNACLRRQCSILTEEFILQPSISAQSTTSQLVIQLSSAYQTGDRPSSSLADDAT